MQNRKKYLPGTRSHDYMLIGIGIFCVLALVTIIAMVYILK
ncbi:MAG: hypothetical protein SH856_03690 [Flavobacteriales bacterium]|nr:hypothetical protein [Flavobacteriales bacterium]